MARLPDSLANWRALDAELGPDALRIASYNVNGCRGTDGRKDAQRIVRVIEECGSDTVGLQEVDYRLDPGNLGIGVATLSSGLIIGSGGGIFASGAARTVNKQRAEHGETKKKG